MEKAGGKGKGPKGTRFHTGTSFFLLPAMHRIGYHSLSKYFNQLHNRFNSHFPGLSGQTNKHTNKPGQKQNILEETN